MLRCPKCLALQPNRDTCYWCGAKLARVMTKKLKWDKCQQIRNQLAKDLFYERKILKQFTDEEWQLYSKIFDYVFDLGQFAMINMILNNDLFYDEDIKEAD